MSEYFASTAQSHQTVIQSDGKSRAKWNWVFALVWNGFVFSIIYFQGPKLLKVFQEEPIFYVFILFPIIGIFLLYSTITDVVNWFRFGETPLTLNTSPVYIGGNISGFIDINTPFVPDMKAEVSVRCTHHYITKTGSERNSTSTVVWQDGLLMPCQSQGDKIRVLFSFPVEDDLPQTQGKGRERHEWNVVMKLPVVGKDLVRVYIVSVAKYYPLEGAKNEQSAQQILGAAPSMISAESPLGAQQTNKSVPHMSTTHEGKRYFYPASRNRVMGIVLLFVSLFVGAMTFGMLNAFADFLPTASILFSLPLILVGIFTFLFGLLVLCSQLEVVVGRSGISVSHKVLFYRSKNKLKPDKIADIKIGKGGSSSSGADSTVWYQLNVIGSNGLETSVGDSLAGSSFAKQIRQEMIDVLGHGWQPSEVVAKPSKLEKVKAFRKSSYSSWLQKLFPLVTTLAVAYDLYYKFGPD